MVPVTLDWGDVSGVGEFDAEEKESRKPNEGLHGVVEARRSGGRRRLGSTNVSVFVLTQKRRYPDYVSPWTTRTADAG